jgi:hypothetical protein
MNSILSIQNGLLAIEINYCYIVFLKVFFSIIY